MKICILVLRGAEFFVCESTSSMISKTVVYNLVFHKKNSLNFRQCQRPGELSKKLAL